MEPTKIGLEALRKSSAEIVWDDTADRELRKTQLQSSLIFFTRGES